MQPEDIPKTSIVTQFGLLGIHQDAVWSQDAGQAFQRLMNQVGANTPFVFIYLDDILVASPRAEIHKVHLQTVLHRLHVFDLVLNLETFEPGR
jgi:vacuolar-type H+-ATPase subunit F/Vma7